MAKIIPFSGDVHEQILALLPWYVSDTLDDPEAALVKAHLTECAACSAELERERMLRSKIADFNMDVDHGWQRMRASLQGPTQQKSFVGVIRRKISLGWALTGQVSALAAAVLIMAPWQDRETPDVYQVQGAPAPAARGNFVVMFQANASEQGMRTALAKVHARIVDGPLASGGYVLQIPAADEDRALGALRATPDITLAEPLFTKPAP